MNEKQFVEREIAKDYWHQRQTAEAKRSGFETIGRDGFLRWLEANEHRLIAIAEQNGTRGEAAREAVELYRKKASALTAHAPFDDPNAYLILSGVLEEIESVCHQAKIASPRSAVVGSLPEAGLAAKQLSVLTTEVSVIAVSIPFLPFCNQVSKTLALSLPHTSEDGRFYRAHLSPDEVMSNVRAQPGLLALWTRIIASYAIYGWPPKLPELQLKRRERQATRIQLLKAMELFAVSHEYGHHILKHGSGASPHNEVEAPTEEYDADTFARAVSMNIGINSEPVNPYAASGAGAVIMLGSLELVRRARRVLMERCDDPPVSNTHPPLDERLQHLATLDATAPADYQAAFADMRANFLEIVMRLWMELRPVLYELQASGIRPIPESSDASGWLPLLP